MDWFCLSIEIQLLADLPNSLLDVPLSGLFSNAEGQPNALGIGLQQAQVLLASC